MHRPRGTAANGRFLLSLVVLPFWTSF